MRYLLIFCLLHIFGGLFSQSVEYYTNPEDELYGYRYFEDPDGKTILLNGGTVDNYFYYLDSNGVMSSIDQMPPRSSFGDTIARYLFAEPYQNGFITAVHKVVFRNGIYEDVRVDIELYDWNFERIAIVDNPGLDSVFTSINFNLIEDTLYFIGCPTFYNGDTVNVDYEKFNLFKLNLDNSELTWNRPTVPNGVTQQQLMVTLFGKSLDRKPLNRIGFIGSIRHDSEIHLLEMDLIKEKWIVSKIPGNLYELPLAAGPIGSFTMAKYQDSLLLCVVGHFPLMEGDFNHTQENGGLAYFYLLDSALNVVHKIRYQQEVYKQIDFNSFRFGAFIDLNDQTFKHYFPYTAQGDLNPYTQEVLEDGFFGIEFEVATGQELNTWFVKRDEVLPINYNPSVYSNSALGIIQKDSRINFLFWETLNFGKYHFSLASLTMDHLVLGLKEFQKPLAFSLHPNPFESSIHVALKGQGTFVITDLAGKFMDSGVLAGNTKIDLEELPSGMYLFQLMSSDGRTAVRSFVKK
jgi:hypothetical protein